jgi:DNA repair exonuclease SbcCD nuclease subunit
MKHILTSDLHSNFSKNTPRILEKFFNEMNKDIKEQDIKALIIAGDLASSKQKDLTTLFKIIRKRIDIPVIICRGNHDFWDQDNKSIDYTKMIENQSNLFTKYNIKHIDEKLVIDDVLICGFDGWYWKIDVNTNDRNFIPLSIEQKDPFVYLSNKAYNDLDCLLNEDLSKYRAKVLVTHFPPFTDNIRYSQYCANSNYMLPICNNFDILCVGHSHRKNDFMEGNCRVLNCGSDYDNPKYVVFDV